MWRIALIAFYGMVLFYLLSALFGILWALFVNLTILVGFLLFGGLVYAASTDDEENESP